MMIEKIVKYGQITLVLVGIISVFILVSDMISFRPHTERFDFWYIIYHENSSYKMRGPYAICKAMAYPYVKRIFIVGDYLKCQMKFRNYLEKDVKNLVLYQGDFYFNVDLTKEPIDVLNYNKEDESWSRDYVISPGGEADLEFEVRVPSDAQIAAFQFLIFDEDRLLELYSDRMRIEVNSYSDYLAKRNAFKTSIWSIVTIIIMIILALLSVKIQINLAEDHSKKLSNLLKKIKPKKKK